MSRAKRFEKWFLRYGLTKSDKKVSDKFRFGREAIWFILAKVAKRSYERGYKDGYDKGIIKATRNYYYRLKIK